MEVYNVNGCNEFPADDHITFTQLTIRDNEKPFTPTWQPMVDATDCQEVIIRIDLLTVIERNFHSHKSDPYFLQSLLIKFCYHHSVFV